MLFENVKMILDISANTKEDVLVAELMAIKENESKEQELKFAGKFIDRYYDEITKCRRMNDNDTIEKLCYLYENDKKAFNTLIDEIEDRVEE